MRTVLVTGGSGFFGGLLQTRLLDDGFSVVNVDLVKDPATHANLTSLQADIRDVPAMEKVFAEHAVEAVFHCAAMLAHAIKDKRDLWTSNVDGTRNIAELAKKHKVPKVVFTSSNCLWAKNFHRPVTEEDTPAPIETYGVTKWEGEKILLQYTGDFDCTIIRTPTIIDCGRLGLLSILFDFILEGRKVWVVGGGRNRYQFVYGPDLADACVKAIGHAGSGVYNVGSDDVKSLRDCFEYVAQKAGTGARVRSLPRRLTLFAMKVAHVLKISPLGPYHYKMIAEDFCFDTSKIKRDLLWQPTLTNETMLLRAYEYYRDNKAEIASRTDADASAHRQPAKMGIIKVLKWIS